jgi:methyl-accepting chemotaxis protein
VVAVAFALLLAVLTGIQRQYVTEAEASAGWVAHTYAALADLNGTIASLVDAETGQRGFLITGEDRYLEPYLTAAGAADTRMADLATLIADNPDQRRDIALVRTLAREKLDELE